MNWLREALGFIVWLSIRLRNHEIIKFENYAQTLIKLTLLLQ